MKKSWWPRSVFNRRPHGKKPPHRKSERRLTVELVEPRVLLTATLTVQPERITAGQVGYLDFALDGQITAPATLNYAVTNGSAVQGSDFFVPPEGMVTIQPGQIIPTTVPIFTNADPTATANKSFTVTLSNPSSGLSLGTSQIACTIVEPPPSAQPPGAGTPATPPAAGLPTVSIRSPGAVTEGSDADFLVTLSRPPASAVQVQYATQDGTAVSGVNYAGESGYILIPAGATYGWISVQTLNDQVYEQDGDGDFTVNLTGASGAAVPAGPTADAVIANVNASPTATVTGPLTRVNEGGTATFQISLSSTSSTQVIVYYSTQNGSAVSGANGNYTQETGSVTIPAGQSTATVNVPTRDDHVYERDDLEFTLNLTGASGASVSAGTCAPAYIHNIDPPSANYMPTCSCQMVTEVGGGLLINGATIPGGADLGSPDADGQDFSVAPPVSLAVYSSPNEVVISGQDGSIQVWSGPPGGPYTAKNGITQGTLIGGNGANFIETDTDGTQWVFAGASGSGYNVGSLFSVTSPDDGSITYSYLSGSWSSSAQTSGGTESGTYSLNSSGKVISVARAEIFN